MGICGVHVYVCNGDGFVDIFWFVFTCWLVGTFYDEGGGLSIGVGACLRVMWQRIYELGIGIGIRIDVGVLSSGLLLAGAGVSGWVVASGYCFGSFLWDWAWECGLDRIGLGWVGVWMYHVVSGCSRTRHRNDLFSVKI